MPNFADNGAIQAPEFKSTVRDYSTLFNTVGLNLTSKNETYSKFYLDNIITPLSSVETTPYGKKIIEGVQAELNTDFESVKQEGNWFQSASKINEWVEKIKTNKGLKAAMADKAQYDAWMKQLDESGLSQEDKTSLIYQSKYQSTDIDYDFDNDMVNGGGWYGVQIQKPFDVQGLITDLNSIVSKAEANDITTEQLLTNPSMLRQYGIDSILGMNGEEIASHIIKFKNRNKSVNRNELLQYTYQLLKSNPEYKAWLAFESKNRQFDSRIVKDNSERGFHLRDYTIDDLANNLDEAQLPMALAGLGIDYSKFGFYNNRNEYVLRKLNSEDKAKLDEVEDLLGSSLSDVLNGKVNIDDEILSNGLNIYLTNYVNRNGGDINVITSSLLTNKYINEHTQALATSIAGINSMGSTIENTFELIKNDAYTEMYKQYAKGSTNITEFNPNASPTIGSLNAVNLEDTFDNYIGQEQSLAEDKIRLQNQYDNINFTAVEKQVLGLNVIHSDKNTILDIPFDDFKTIVSNSNLSTEEQDTLIAKYNLAKDLQAAKNAIEVQESKNKETFDNYYEYFKTIDDKDKYPILKHGWKSYNEYLNYVKNNDYKLSYSNSAVIGQKYYKNHNGKLSYYDEIAFNDELKKELNRLNKHHQNTTGESLETISMRNLVSNPTRQQYKSLEQKKQLWASGAGELEFISGSKDFTKLYGDNTGILKQLIELNTFPTSITNNSKGESVTVRNQITKNTPFIQIGDHKIYETSIHYANNPAAALLGKQEYVIDLKDETGTIVDQIVVADATNISTVNQDIQQTIYDISYKQGAFGLTDVDEKTLGHAYNYDIEVNYKLNNKPIYLVTKELPIGTSKRFDLDVNSHDGTPGYANGEVEITRVNDGYQMKLLKDVSANNGYIFTPHLENGRNVIVSGSTISECFINAGISLGILGAKMQNFKNY